MSPISCPYCRAGNASNSPICWVCRTPLGGTSGFVIDRPVGGDSGWIIVTIVSMLVLGAAGFELLNFAPGFIVPYAIVVLPLLGVLARILYVQRLDFWKSKAPSALIAEGGVRPPGAARQRTPQQQAAENELLSTIGLSIAIVFISIAAVVLLFFAGVVVLILICIASM